MSKFQKNEQQSRIMFILISVCIVLIILVLRIAYITIVKGNEYKDMAESQWNSEIIVPAKRGDILDRNGEVLASSANVYRVDLDLKSLKEKVQNDNEKLDEIAMELSTTLNLEVESLKEIIYGNNIYPNILRGVEKEIADKVKELNIYGVLVLDDVKRYYPNDNYLSKVLGGINSDGNGITGIELKYNDYLAGVPGLKIEGVDSAQNKHPLVADKFTPPVEGKDVILTIDENIQYFAEETANKAMLEHKAKGVYVVVTNPNNGEILAMVNKPDYNPNIPFEGYENFAGANESEKLETMWRNNLVSTPYEPGSTFKVVTMIAALEEGVTSEEDTFNCTGSVKFGDTTVRCWKTDGHGVQSLGDILKNSCNPGFMELGSRLGSEKLTNYIKKLGFGKGTGIDLPGEATGILKDPKTMREIDIATVAFGQSNTVTTVQLMSAFNAIANGGNLIEPHLVKEISYTNKSGNTIVDETFKPTKQTDILSDENTAKLRSFLERTVTSKDGEEGFIQGYSIGGKTGTAEKIDPETGKYADGKYISSMIALAPVENPQVSVYIAVDEPSAKGYYGGEVVSPLMKDLFKKILDYMESPTANGQYAITKDIIIPEVRGLTIDEAEKILHENKINVTISGKGSVVKTMNPYPGTTVKESSVVELEANSKKADNEVILPELKGMTVEYASDLLNNLGLKYELEGSGKVYYQSIPSGTLLKKGSTVRLTLKEESLY